MTLKHRFDPARAICTEDDPAAAELRRTLDEFYARTTEYTSFHKVTHKPEFWSPIVRRIEEIDGRSDDETSVLEFGAGTTGFASFMPRELRERVRFVAQDVTDQNREHLEKECERVVVGDLSDVDERFDVMFSTFVWEHVSNPRATLGVMLRMLKPGGSIFLACPRYDVFGYTPATAKHLPRLERIKLAFWLRSRRARARREGKPAFLIHSDPAMLHTDWFRDADAIHWVARDDLAMSLPEGYELRDVESETNAKGMRSFVYRRFLLLFVEVRAPEQ